MYKSISNLADLFPNYIKVSKRAKNKRAKRASGVNLSTMPSATKVIGIVLTEAQLCKKTALKLLRDTSWLKHHKLKANFDCVKRAIDAMHNSPDKNAPKIYEHAYAGWREGKS